MVLTGRKELEIEMTAVLNITVMLASSYMVFGSAFMLI
jgi:hypothetical protein